MLGDAPELESYLGYLGRYLTLAFSTLRYLPMMPLCAAGQ